MKIRNQFHILCVKILKIYTSKCFKVILGTKCSMNVINSSFSFHHHITYITQKIIHETPYIKINSIISILTEILWLCATLIQD